MTRSLFASKASATARFVVPALGLAIAAWLVSRSDLAGAATLLSRSPALVLLLPLTYAASSSLEVLGFRMLLAGRGVEPKIAWLLRFRLMSDALIFSIPSGALVAEGLNYTGLTRTHGLAHRATLVVLIWRRILVACAHATVAVGGAWLGRDFLSRIASITEVDPDAKAGLSAALILLLAAGVVAARLTRKARANLEDLSLPPGRGLAAFGLFLASWLVEAVDTYLVLLVLGAGLPFLAILSFEGLLSVARSLAIFVPAGLGVQDVGYMFVLQGLGVPGALALGTAFLLLKRSRELALVIIGWIGVGREWRALNPLAGAL